MISNYKSYGGQMIVKTGVYIAQFCQLYTLFSIIIFCVKIKEKTKEKVVHILNGIRFKSENIAH